MVLVAITMAIVVPVRAASQTATPNGQKMEFEVASVKQNTAEPSPQNPANSNFPMGPGDVYTKTGGLFTATNLPLDTYIFFAFKVTPNQGQSLEAHLPDWVKSERFDIHARAQGEPTKDQMRMMVLSLLEKRFKMVWHRETQQVPVYGLTVAKPGVFGPMFQPHPADAVCSSSLASPTSEDASPSPPPTTGADGRFPTVCGGLVALPPSKGGNFRMGGRNVSMEMIASTLTFAGNLGRPVLDQTGLKGTYDISLEFSRENGVGPTAEATPRPEDAGPTFQQALKEQLGLKLDSTKGPLETVVIDHIELPSEN